MLDGNARPQDLATWVHSLPCYVELPEKLRRDFNKSGPVPVPSEDLRRYRRIYCRGEKHKAALNLCTSLPALPRKNSWQCVYTSDVSHKGCGFLHSEMLFPGERLRLVFLNGLDRAIEVAWCRRLDKSCFLIGSQFVG